MILLCELLRNSKANIRIYGLTQDSTVLRSALQFTFEMPRYHLHDYYEINGSKIYIWTKYPPGSRRLLLIFITLILLVISVEMIRKVRILVKKKKR